MPIRFFSEGIDFKLKGQRRKAEWIKLSAAREKRNVKDILYVFCTDAFLLKINQDFLAHNTLTDIITFDYSEGREISGEIYISLERVKENAAKYDAAFQTELDRVMIHGILHLCGYSDKKALEKATMRKKEEAYLSLQKRST